VQTPVGATALGYGVAVQNGKLVVAGSAYTTTGVNATIRLNPDGALDPTYGQGGISTIATWNGANGLTLDPAARIVLPAVGASADRFTPDGAPDQTFGQGGIATAQIGSASAANGAAIQLYDGAIVLGGAATINGQSETQKRL
jgi:hypothetical protein